MTVHGTIESRTRVGNATLVVTRYDANTSLDAHVHREPYVSIVMDGSYTEVCGHDPVLCSPGTILLHDTSETHADFFLEPARLLNIEVEAEAAQSITDVVAAIAGLTRYPAAIRRLLQAASATLRAERSEEEGPQWLGEALERLDWAREDDIRSIAGEVGVHPTHFARSFKIHMGMTPSFYRARRRVRQASDLLLSTSRRLASIAVDCGFSDQSHFTRVFSATVGMSPAVFRSTFSR